MWGHTERDALLIALLTGTGLRGYLAALLHMEADRLPPEQVQILTLLLGVQSGKTQGK